MAKRSAQGSGTIRQRKDGSWEARYTVGRDPGTGKQVQKSVYGTTQAEVRKKLNKITLELDQHTYTAPSRVTVQAWLTDWQENYLDSVKPATREKYSSTIRVHILPSIGALRLQELTAENIQRFIRSMSKSGLSPKTVKCVYGTLHRCLEQAVKNKLIPFNPSASCVLPKQKKPQLTVLDSDTIPPFIAAAKGNKYELPIIITMFTGMRQGEVMGLTWDNVDFENSVIHIIHQLQRINGTSGQYRHTTLKNDTTRIIPVAPFVMDMFKQQKNKQIMERLAAGELWEGNPLNLVFTTETGTNITAVTLLKHFKKIAESVGIPKLRFHDLRHTFATLSLQNGDDIKTVQSNLGHANASFTLNTYSHYTSEMQKKSASRMQKFIENTVLTN